MVCIHNIPSHIFAHCNHINVPTHKHTRNHTAFEPVPIDLDNPPAPYCFRCNMVQPLRAKHDYNIDACVAVFDSHQPFIGNVIGAYNHKYYLWLMTLDSFVYIACFIMAIDVLVKFGNGNYSNIFGWGIMIVLLLYTLWLMLFSVALTLFHFYLAFANKTLYEMTKPQIAVQTTKYLNSLKNEMNDDFNGHDYSKGCMRNMLMFMRGYTSQHEWFYGIQCEIVEDIEDNQYSYAEQHVHSQEIRVSHTSSDSNSESSKKSGIDLDLPRW